MTDKNDSGKPEEYKQGKVKRFFVGLGKSSAVTTTTTLVAAGLTKAGLTGAGFSSLGPVAGSIAAGLQASAGNVAAGSWFAFFQSAGMCGITPLLWPAIPIGVTAGGIYWWRSAKNKQQNQKYGQILLDPQYQDPVYAHDEIYAGQTQQRRSLQRIEDQKLMEVDHISELSKKKQADSEPKKSSKVGSLLRFLRIKKQIDNKNQNQDLKQNTKEDLQPNIIFLEQISSIPKQSWRKQPKQIENRVRNDKQK